MPEPDFAHLMECVDPHCCYCNEQDPRETEIERFLRIVACPPLAEREAKAA